MRFLKTLFDASYRAARRAEGQRAFRRAAQLYLRADAPEDAARALLFHAAVAERPEERVLSYREALEWLTPGSARHEQVEERFSMLLLEECARRKEPTTLRSEWLREAGQRLSGLGRHREAARAYALLDDVDAQKQALVAAGDLDALEALLEAERQAHQAGLAFTSAMRDFERCLELGARIDARVALQRAASAAAGEGQRATLAERRRDFERRLPHKNILKLAVAGAREVWTNQTDLVVGRAGADLELRDGAVSRRHLRVAWSEKGCVLEDLNSRFGSWVAGMQLREALQTEAAVDVRVSDDTVLRVTPLAPGGGEPSRHEQGVRVAVREGPAAPLVLVAAPSPTALDSLGVSLRFTEGLPQLAANSPNVLHLNGTPCFAPVELLLEDCVEVLSPEGERVRAEVLA